MRGTRPSGDGEIADAFLRLRMRMEGGSVRLHIGTQMAGRVTDCRVKMMVCRVRMYSPGLEARKLEARKSEVVRHLGRYGT